MCMSWYALFTHQLGTRYTTPDIDLPVPLERLVVDGHAGRWPRLAEPVQADPLADLLVRPRVVVRPRDQILVYPSQQPDGAVRKHRSDGVRSCLHDLEVCAAVDLLTLGGL